jgi:hypothetical protein
MRLFKALILGFALSAVTGAVFAGEDTTYREHCTGLAFWEKSTGVSNFDQSKAECGSTVRAG